MHRIALLLCVLLVGNVSAQDFNEARRDSRAMLSELESALTATQGKLDRRQRLILQLAQAREADIDERDLVWLSGHVQANPADSFAQLYEGYGWLLMARRYMERQNYFRAAELAKRGFFLIDEAVETRPQDWRLRLLRARMDAVLSAEFGRYVVALADLDVLDTDASVPAQMKPLLDYLRLRASARAERTAEVERLTPIITDSPLGFALEHEEQLPLSRAEMEHVLRPALGVNDV